MAVLDSLGPISTLDGDQIILSGDGLVIGHLAHLETGVDQDIVGLFVVDGTRTGGHGLIHGDIGLELLIFHADEAGCPVGGYIVLGDDGGDVVAIEPHPAVEQLPVGHILMGLFHRPGMAGGGEGDVGDIEAGEDLDHAGDGKGLLQMEGLDLAEGDGAVDDFCHQIIAGLQV